MAGLRRGWWVRGIALIGGTATIALWIAEQAGASQLATPLFYVAAGGVLLGASLGGLPHGGSDGCGIDDGDSSN